MTRWIALISGLFLVFSFQASGYERPTHEFLSKKALEASRISSTPSIRERIGLDVGPMNEASLRHPNGAEYTPYGLIEKGAYDEDDLPRSLHHFFDPENDRPLVLLGKERGARSPDWALEDLGEAPSALQQNYSLADAHDYLWQSLGGTSRQEREENLALVFQTLGQVIHHIQDMAQPEHVRNDQHLVLPGFPVDPSLYEEFTLDLTKEGVLDSYVENIRSVDNTSPRSLWTRPDDKGLADFTNQNFVSKDTNFFMRDGIPTPDGDYPLPVWNGNTYDLARYISPGFTNGGNACAQLRDKYPAFQNVSCSVTSYGIDIHDTIDGVVRENRYGATYSVFNQYLDENSVDFCRGRSCQMKVDRFFTLNTFNLKEYHRYLLPKAVGFSAELINDFFAHTFLMTKAGATASDGFWETNFSLIGLWVHPSEPSDVGFWVELDNGNRMKLPVVDLIEESTGNYKITVSLDGSVLQEMFRENVRAKEDLNNYSIVIPIKIIVAVKGTKDGVQRIAVGGGESYFGTVANYGYLVIERLEYFSNGSDYNNESSMGIRRVVTLNRSVSEEIKILHSEQMHVGNQNRTPGQYVNNDGETIDVNIHKLDGYLGIPHQGTFTWDVDSAKRVDGQYTDTRTHLGTISRVGDMTDYSVTPLQTEDYYEFPETPLPDETLEIPYLLADDVPEIFEGITKPIKKPTDKSFAFRVFYPSFGPCEC